MSGKSKISFYLNVEASVRGNWVQLKTPKVSSKKPKSVNGVSIKCTLELPDSLFKEPQFQATIAIDESKVSREVIESKVVDNIVDVIQESTGLTLTLVQEDSDG